MRVSVVQMSPGTDKDANIAQADGLIADVVAEGRPGLVCLPEMWTCLGGDRQRKLEQSEALPRPGSPEPAGAAYAFLKDTARRHGIYLHGGSLCERDGDQLFNTTVAFGPDGGELARYRKIHMFDIVTPEGVAYGESRTYAAGEALAIYDAGGVRVGCAICYDLRFPELFLALRRAGATLILLPAAFTVETGRDHWEPLLRARAIETQCWVAASATWGRHEAADGAPRFTYGHSMIVDPWGAVVARAPDGTGAVTARIDTARADRIRRDMPVLDQRRLA